MTKKKKKIGKSLYMWMRTYLIILILMSGLLIILTNWMVESFSREIMKLNHSLTSNIQSGMDIRLNDIDDFSAQLQLSNANLYLSKAREPEEVNTRMLIQLYAQLNDYKISNTFIDSIYIYYPDLDYVVGNLGYFPARKYYLLTNELNYDGYDAWIENITVNRSSGYYFEGRDLSSELYFSRRLPYDNSDRKKAILMIRINKDEVRHMLENDKYARKNSINAIAGEDGRVYTYSGSPDKLDGIVEILQNQKGMSYITQKGYFGSVQTSDYYQIKYIRLDDRKQILSTSYFIKNMAYLSLAVCMAAGFLLFSVLGSRNNRPIKKILEKLQYAPKQGDRRLLDDYGLIDRGIDAMLASERTSRKKLEEQRNTIEGLFLYNLLSSEEKNNSIIFASMQRFNLQFEFSLFQIMLLRNKRGFTQPEINNLIDAVTDMIKSQFEELYVIGTEFKEDIVLLFHMEPRYHKDQMEETARAVLQKMDAAAEGALLFGGGIYDTMSHIITSYHQARMLAEAEKNPKQRLMFYDVETMMNKMDEIKSTGIMAEYEMSMLERNFENARKQIDLLFNQYIGADHNVFTARTKKYAVLNPLIEAFNQIPDGKKTEEFINRLSEARDHQMLLDVMHDMFKILIRSQKEEQAERKEGMAQQAENYINLNFEDSMIGLYSISDMLGVSNTYLSTVFKKSYGIGIVQYINRLRIEKAKKLILNTDYNIKEVALSVGFTSDVTFIRVFKQFENTTPGKFKKGSPEKRME